MAGNHSDALDIFRHVSEAALLEGVEITALYTALTEAFEDYSASRPHPDPARPLESVFGPIQRKARQARPKLRVVEQPREEPPPEPFNVERQNQ